MKKLSKKTIIICVSLVVVVMAVIIGLVINKDNNTKVSSNATDIKSILNSATKLDVNINSAKRVELTNIDLKDNEKVKIWVFSEPIYLGEFNLINDNGKYYLENLESLLKSKNLSNGNHKVLLLQSDKALGYFNITIQDNTLLSSEEMPEIPDDTTDNDPEGDSQTTQGSGKITTKTIKVEEEIAFETEEVEEKNMLKGQRETAVAGTKGKKAITYKVTYDENNNEVKREKVSEKITKEPKKAQVKVGISDYNLNNNIEYTIQSGLICDEDSARSMDYQECNTEKDTTYSYYQSIEFSGKNYIICFNEKECDDYFDVHFKSSSKPLISRYQSIYTVTYNGRKYFLDARSGRQGNVLTEDICKNMGLVCNRW